MENVMQQYIEASGKREDWIISALGRTLSEKYCPHTCVYEVLWCERAAGNNWFIFIVLHLYIQELDAKGVSNKNDLIFKEFFIRQ